MASSVWNGSLAVSLLNVPVKLVPGQSDGNIELHQYRVSDASRVKFKRYAEADGVDGPEVPWSDIGKGYEAGDGSIVMLTDDDIKAAYGETDKVGQILMFTHIDRVPRMAAAKSYLIKPAVGGERTYSLLVAAMQAAGKVAVLRYAMRERPNLAMIHVVDNYLVLEQLRWAEDINKPDFAVPSNSWSADEIKQAVALIDSMTDDFDYDAYKDDTRTAIDELVRRKIEGGESTAPTKPAVQDGGQAFPDLMAGIQASLAAQAAAKTPKQRTPRARKKVSA